MTMRSALATLWLAACGAAPPMIATADECGVAEGLVLDSPAPIASQWNGSSMIGGEGTLSVRWCGAGSVAIEQLVTTHGETRTYDPAVSRLAHGESFDAHFLGTAQPATFQVVIHARDETGAELVVAAEASCVLDPAFVRARDACTAVGGTFGPVGMARTYACDRPTRDAGRRCLSSADCEGPCIDDHVEVTTSAPDGRTCTSGEELRLHVGTCYARSLLFGCSARLMEVTTECLRTALLGRRSSICVD